MISSMLVMMNHVDETMQQGGKPTKSNKLDTIGRPYTKMLNNTLHIVMNIKGLGNLQRGMKCLCILKYD